MKLKIIFNKVGSIILYIASCLYIFNTILLYSISNNLYILNLIFAILALMSGLFYSYFKDQIKDVREWKYKQIVLFSVFTFFSLTCPIATIFAFLSVFLKGEGEIKPERYIEPIEKDERIKPFIKRTSTLLSIISLTGIFLFGFFAQLVETSGYTVQVSDHRLTKAMTEEYNNTPINGKKYVIDNDCLSYSYTMYKPNKASASSKAPVLFVIPGFTRTKETMFQYCIEMSRRGFVCFVIDPGCQGETTYAGIKHDDEGHVVVDDKGNPVDWSSSVSANGMNYLVQYVYNNTSQFDFIDRTKIGIFGHSQGALNSIMVAQNFAGTSYNESVIKAMQISGYYAGISGRFQHLRCNACISYGLYEEGYYNGTYETVALKFINNVNGEFTYHYEDFEIDKDYGDVIEGTYRILRREKINHVFTMYSQEAIRNTINFFNKSLSIENVLDGNNQVWWIKEVFTGVCLVFGFILIVNISKMLINTKFFSNIKGEKPKEVSTIEIDGEVYKKKQRLIDKIVFWLTTLFTAILACLDYMPLTELAIKWFPEANAGHYTFEFPARMINGVMLWAVFNGLVGLLIFFGTILIKNLIYFIYAKAKKQEPVYDFEQFKALKIGILPLLKTILLSIILFFVFFGGISLIRLIFHQDYRFFMVSGSPLFWRHVVAWLMYIPFFFIFYLSNSIRANLGIGFEGFKEHTTYIVAALANSVGLIAILILQYGKYALTGQCMWSSFLYINMVFGIAAMMALLPIMNRLFYKQTNRPYLGALVTVMIFIMMTLSASVNFIPI